MNTDVLSLLDILSRVILPNLLHGKLYYLHFTHEETEAEGD